MLSRKFSYTVIDRLTLEEDLLLDAPNAGSSGTDTTTAMDAWLQN
jgi:hypothetical protein